jgi:hypothetical protein
LYQNAGNHVLLKIVNLLILFMVSEPMIRDALSSERMDLASDDIVAHRARLRRRT